MVTNVTDFHIVALVTLEHPKCFASGYSLLCLVANEEVHILTTVFKMLTLTFKDKN